MSFNENDFLSFWFTTMRKWWFGCPTSIDSLVYMKYFKYLDVNFEKSDDIRVLLARIILNDQVSRHVSRFLENTITTKHYDEKALFILENNNVINRLEELNPEERCFAIMPWRHTFKEDNLLKCLELVTNWMSNSSEPMYNRFYQATIKALANINNNKELKYITNVEPPELCCPILDPKSSKLFKIKSVDISNRLANEFIENCKPVEGKLIVSVSGGVDSMVCLILAKTCYPSAKIKAISINYANREEQKLEIDMVNYICNQLKIEHYVRTISEIKRVRDSHREFYESITREIRFNCYKNLTDGKNIPVILGHNQDDTLENVFSNIKKRINYENLFGMEHISIEKNINIYRPLLKIPKSVIIQFAHEHNIPYTYDSTASWSERGRLRDILMPSLKSFDRDLIPGIIEMVNNFKEIYQIYENSLPKIKLVTESISCNQPFYEIQCNKNIFILDYWKRIFSTISNNYNVSFVRNKSILHFISQIKNKDNETKLYDYDNITKNVVLSRYLYAVIPKYGGYISVHLTELALTIKRNNV